MNGSGGFIKSSSVISNAIHQVIQRHFQCDLPRHSASFPMTFTASFPVPFTMSLTASFPMSFTNYHIIQRNFHCHLLRHSQFHLPRHLRRHLPSGFPFLRQLRRPTLRRLRRRLSFRTKDKDKDILGREIRCSWAPPLHLVLLPGSSFIRIQSRRRRRRRLRRRRRRRPPSDSPISPPTKAITKPAPILPPKTPIVSTSTRNLVRYG